MLRRGCSSRSLASVATASSSQQVSHRWASGGAGSGSGYDKDRSKPWESDGKIPTIADPKPAPKKKGDNDTFREPEFFFQSPQVIKDDIHQPYVGPSGSSFVDASNFPKADSQRQYHQPKPEIPFTGPRGMIDSEEDSGTISPGRDMYDQQQEKLQQQSKQKMELEQSEKTVPSSSSSSSSNSSSSTQGDAGAAPIKLKQAAGEETSAPQAAEDEGSKTRTGTENIFFEPADTAGGRSTPRTQVREPFGAEHRLDPGMSGLPKYMQWFVKTVSDKTDASAEKEKPGYDTYVRTGARRGRPIENDGNQNGSSVDFMVPFFIIISISIWWNYKYADRMILTAPSEPPEVVGALSAETISRTGREYMENPSNKFGAAQMESLAKSSDDRSNRVKAPFSRAMANSSSRADVSQDLM